MSIMHKATKPSDIPSKPHFAIIRFNTTSVHIPGDERSRTNPGHGYPERTETYSTNEYYYTFERQTWVEEIQAIEKRNSNRSYDKDLYAAIEVASKASVEINVVVGVKT